MTMPHLSADIGCKTCECGWVVPDLITPLQLQRPRTPADGDAESGPTIIPAQATVTLRAMALDIPGFAALVRCPECGTQHIVTKMTAEAAPAEDAPG